MNSVDPLERAFEFIKADSTGLAVNPNLENRLMKEFHKQNRPSRWKRTAWVLAALMAMVFAGGGIATAAGYHPFGYFTFSDEHGNAIDFQVQQSVMNADGSVTITGTVDGGSQTVNAVFVPAEGNK
jgi:hypothetical protein